MCSFLSVLHTRVFSWFLHLVFNNFECCHCIGSTFHNTVQSKRLSYVWASGQFNLVWIFEQDINVESESRLPSFEVYGNLCSSNRKQLKVEQTSASIRGKFWWYVWLLNTFKFDCSSFLHTIKNQSDESQQELLSWSSFSIQSD